LKLLALAVLTAAALTALLFISNLLTVPNLFLSDRLYQRVRPPEASIYIIGIDDTALREIGPWHTWTRSVIAEVIEVLNAGEDNHPAAIGVDLMYFGHTAPEHDQRMANAAALRGNVVMAASVKFMEEITGDGANALWERNVPELVELPYPELLNASTAGHINFSPDIDGIIRHAFQYIDMPPALEAEMGFARLPSFALAVYQKYARTMGLPENPDVPARGRHNAWQIPYTSRPTGFSDGFSVWDILNGSLPPEIFAGSIVLIGPYTIGLFDSHSTPMASAPMFGVEIHANVIDAMARGIYYADVPGALILAVTFLVLLGLFTAFYLWHPALSAILMLGVSGGYLLLARQLVFPAREEWFLFGGLRYLLPPLQLPLGAFLLYVGILAVQFLIERRQKKQVTDTFMKYVDPVIIDDIFKTGMDNLQLGGRTADVCVMFVDIRGFTPMSEVMPPHEVVALLNDYLEITSSAVFRHKGTLDKFIGDATMAFWGAPMPQDDIVYRAVLAAWDIVQSGRKLEDELREKYGRVVSFGIGLNVGKAVVGNIGTALRMDYTVIGNTVNTASRLESVARPGQILLSESVYRAVESRITARCAGNIPLKGKSEELTVYALESIREYENQHEPLASAMLEPGKG